jgi:hypothetical protein
MVSGKQQRRLLGNDYMDFGAVILRTVEQQTT